MRVLYNYLVVFLSRVSILTRDIDIANLSVCPSVCLSVRYVPVVSEIIGGGSQFTLRGPAPSDYP